MALFDLLPHYLLSLVLVGAFWFVAKSSFFKRTKEEFVLDRILVHPIKSCRASELQESAYSALGLEYDRKWMLVYAETHKAATAREIPQLVTISPVIDKINETLVINIPGFPSFRTPLDPTAEEVRSWQLISDVTLWASTMDAHVLPDPELHKALSAFCGKEVLLIIKGPTPRLITMMEDQTLYPTPQTLPSNSETAFADGYPFLLVSTWSIDEVEANIAASFRGAKEWAVKPALEGEIGEKWNRGEGDIMRRTRGNLVISGKGGKAWDEDTWGVIRVGEEGKEGQGEEIVVISMCGRCQLPNVDPATGIPHPSIPYKVLSKYRRTDPVDKFSPCFGVNAAPMASQGILRVGDKVRVVKKNAWVRREQT